MTDETQVGAPDYKRFRFIIIYSFIRTILFLGPLNFTIPIAIAQDKNVLQTIIEVFNLLVKGAPDDHFHPKIFTGILLYAIISTLTWSILRLCFPKQIIRITSQHISWFVFGEFIFFVMLSKYWVTPVLGFLLGILLFLPYLFQ